MENSIIDWGHRNISAISNAFTSNFIYKDTESLILKCNNKSSIRLYNYEITHFHRKYFVMVMTIGSMLLFKRFKIRYGLSYFVFYSLIFCRENLNPYL